MKKNKKIKLLQWIIPTTLVASAVVGASLAISNNNSHAQVNNSELKNNNMSKAGSSATSVKGDLNIGVDGNYNLLGNAKQNFFYDDWNYVMNNPNFNSEDSVFSNFIKDQVNNNITSFFDNPITASQNKTTVTSATIVSIDKKENGDVVANVQLTFQNFINEEGEQQTGKKNGNFYVTLRKGIEETYLKNSGPNGFQEEIKDVIKNSDQNLSENIESIKTQIASLLNAKKNDIPRIYLNQQGSVEIQTIQNGNINGTNNETKTGFSQYTFNNGYFWIKGRSANLNIPSFFVNWKQTVYKGDAISVSSDENLNKYEISEISKNLSNEDIKNSLLSFINNQKNNLFYNAKSNTRATNISDTSYIDNEGNLILNVDFENIIDITSSRKQFPSIKINGFKKNQPTVNTTFKKSDLSFNDQADRETLMVITGATNETELNDFNNRGWWDANADGVVKNNINKNISKIFNDPSSFTKVNNIRVDDLTDKKATLVITYNGYSSGVFTNDIEKPLNIILSASNNDSSGSIAGQDTFGIGEDLKKFIEAKMIENGSLPLSQDDFVNCIREFIKKSDKLENKNKLDVRVSSRYSDFERNYDRVNGKGVLPSSTIRIVKKGSSNSTSDTIFRNGEWTINCNPWSVEKNNIYKNDIKWIILASGVALILIIVVGIILFFVKVKKRKDNATIF